MLVKHSPHDLCDEVSRDEIFLGLSAGHAAFAGSQRSVLALGPSRSGKTSSLIIPNIFLTQRAVVATSTKPDVIATTAAARRDVATIMFDPSGTISPPPGVREVGFSPVRAARRWDNAVLIAQSLVDGHRRGGADGPIDHWNERAGALLAPLLHAASLRDDSLGRLASLVDRRQGDESLELLIERYGEFHPAAGTLFGVLQTDERERSGIWSTASGLLSGLRLESARRASRAGQLDLDSFLKEGHHLHIVSPSRYQAASAPLVVGLLDEIVEAAYARGPHERGLLLALDEIANVAPLPRLGHIVSEGGGQGVVTLACLQDLSQARARWPASGDGFLSLFPTTVIFPGVADRRTLELVSSLSGTTYSPNVTTQRSRRGQLVGHSTSWREHARLDLAGVAQGRSGYALGIGPRRELGWVELAPAHEHALFQSYRERERIATAISRSLPSDRSRERQRE